MKKFFSTLLIAAIALIASVNASAYSEEMAQIAQMLNEQTGGSNGIESVAYDGQNLVINMMPGLTSGEEDELLNQVEEPDALKPIILSSFAESLGSEGRQNFAQVLQMFGANLKLNMPLKSGKILTFNFTPSDLANAE